MYIYVHLRVPSSQGSTRRLLDAPNFVDPKVGVPGHPMQAAQDQTHLRPRKHTQAPWTWHEMSSKAPTQLDGPFVQASNRRVLGMESFWMLSSKFSKSDSLGKHTLGHFFCLPTYSISDWAFRLLSASCRRCINVHKVVKFVHRSRGQP